MALKKTITTAQGFEAVDAYVTCEDISLRGKEQIMFQVKSRKEKGSLTFSDLAYSALYTLEGANPIKQAYEYLKTLPEFADAVDC
jgi:hypothetical protein